MKEIFWVFKDRRCLIRMVISGLLFVILSAPFKILFNLIPGVTEIRPANMLPVVFGLLWGPAGAWGTSLANVAADVVVSKSPLKVWLPGFFINFFFAWLPYKLWYSLRCGKGRSVSPRLERVSQIIKYIYICLLDSLVVTVFLGLLFEALGFQAFADSVMLLFFNNFDFAIVIGTPVILLLTNRKTDMIWIPMEPAVNSRTEGTGMDGFFNRYDVPLFLISAFGILYFITGRNGGARLSSGMDAAALAVIGICLLFYLSKPMDPLEEKSTALEQTGGSIRARVIIGFLILSVTFVVITGATAYLSLNSDESSRRDTWQYIYLVVGIALNLLFIVSLVFLKYVENNITGPLELLTSMVEQFAGRDHTKAGNNREFIESFADIRTGDEIEKLSRSFRQMMSDITDYVENLQVMTAEKERIGAELNVATQIQADMLPQIFPAFPEVGSFDIYASMNPAREVGGDFYDFFLIDEDHLAVVIADVSGKGVPAALFMVIAKTVIKNQAHFTPDPADIFGIVNNQLCEGNQAGLFVTAWMGVLTLSTGEFAYANAGHNPPLICHEHGSFEFLKAPVGFVLAGMEDMSYRKSKLTLSPGDRIYFYTDGVTEAENEKEELYGNDRLRDALNGLRDKSAEEIVAGIRTSVERFSGAAEQFDDITMVALVYLGGGEQ